MAAVLFLALLLAPAPWAAAPNQPAAFVAAVRKAWAGRMALLRGFPAADTLAYGPAGQPLQASPGGPWTLAEMRVTNIVWHRGALRVSGERDGLVLRNDALVPVNLHQTVRLTIQLGADPLDAATVRRLTQAIFVSATELPDAAPRWWREYARHRAAGGGAVPRPALAAVGAGAEIISRPAVLSTPMPSYTPAARQAHLEGTVVLGLVVGRDGRAHDVQVVRPLGLGLDDAAVRAVRRWEFRPAEGRAGTPVPVRARVQVNFHNF